MGKTIMKIALLLVLLAATGFGSYKGVIAIWGEEEITSVTTQAQGTGSLEKRGQKVQKNIITAYYYDNYTKGIIEYAAVRIFNANTKECNFVFFPANTKINLSDATYQKIYSASTNVKQNTYLKDIASCFAQDTDRYRYTTMAIEDAIGQKVDYFEAITSDNVIRIVNLVDPFYFDVPKNMKFKDDSNINIELKKGSQTLLGDQVKGMLTKKELHGSEMKRLKCSEDYVKAYWTAVVTMEDRNKQDQFFKDYYDLIIGSANYKNMLPYFEYFHQVAPSNIVMTTAPGAADKGYQIDKKKLAEIVNLFLTHKPGETVEVPEVKDVGGEAEESTEEVAEGEETTEEDADSEESTEEDADAEDGEHTDEADGEDSKGLKIEIYNSTTINGLAARWKDRLEKDGYKISNTDTERGYHLTDCVIYVSKEGQGEDLKKFFPDAEIKVGTLKDADIRIVLGTNDKNVR